jgi:cytochrome c oxidase assembly factor CtaG
VSSTRTFLSAWTLAPEPTVAMLLALGLYLMAVRAVVRRHPRQPWPRWRLTCFVAGLALAAIVVDGPFGVYDSVLFWAHMVQHIALMMVVAPLLLLGAPVLLALQVSSRPTRRRWILPILRSRAARWLSDPVATWVLFTATLLGTHFTPFYNYAVTHEAVHRYVEHPLYLTAGLLYFYPLVGANPVPHGPKPLAKVVSLLLMMAPETMTGFFIFSADQVLYPAYARLDRPIIASALADQQLGGALMWCSAMVIDVVWITVAVHAWLQAETRAGRRINLQLAAESRARAAQTRTAAGETRPTTGVA